MQESTSIQKPKFSAGKNIAMKVPSHEFESTVAFYRDILEFPLKDAASPDAFESLCFEFGDKNLWIDKVATLSQAELWLEISTDDYRAAQQYLEGKGFVLRNEIEPLPSDFKGFWLSGPANMIHLVVE